ncbi:MAG: hypothetical protein AB7E42_01975 [Anaerotignaceae bacterium]
MKLKSKPWALPKPTCFLKKARQKLLLKSHIYAVLDGSRWQWQRHAICWQDSVAKQSADQCKGKDMPSVHTLVGV